MAQRENNNIAEPWAQLVCPSSATARQVSLWRDISHSSHTPAFLEQDVFKLLGILEVQTSLGIQDKLSCKCPFPGRNNTKDDTPRDVFGRRSCSHFFDLDVNRTEDFLPITAARNGFTGSRHYVVYLRDTNHCHILAELLPAPINS